MEFSDYFTYPSEPNSSLSLPFNKLTKKDWEKITSYAETLLFAQGDLLVNYNDSDNSLYIIVEGECDVFLYYGDNNRNTKLTSIKMGSVIGELSFFDGYPRSATVVANCRVLALKMSLESFQKLSLEIPSLANQFLFELGKILAYRVRKTSSWLIADKE